MSNSLGILLGMQFDQWVKLLALLVVILQLINEALELFNQQNKE